MKAQNEKQIAAEIKKLEASKSYVPKFSGFGDDNHAAIDACIEVLTKRLTEEDCYQRGNDEGEDDESKWTFHARESALDAARWLAGDLADAPSSGWDYLKK